jgi:hypothetical protein
MGAVSLVARLGGDAFKVFDEASNSLMLKPGLFKIAVGGSSADNLLIAKTLKFSAGIGHNPNEGGQGWLVGVIVAAAVVVFALAIVIVMVRGRKSRGYEPAGTGTQNFETFTQ